MAHVCFRACPALTGCDCPSRDANRPMIGLQDFIPRETEEPAKLSGLVLYSTPVSHFPVFDEGFNGIDRSVSPNTYANAAPTTLTIKDIEEAKRMYSFSNEYMGAPYSGPDSRKDPQVFTKRSYECSCGGLNCYGGTMCLSDRHREPDAVRLARELEQAKAALDLAKKRIKELEDANYQERRARAEAKKKTEYFVNRNDQLRHELDKEQELRTRAEQEIESLRRMYEPTPAEEDADAVRIMESLPSAVADAPGIAPKHRVRRNDAVIHCQGDWE